MKTRVLFLCTHNSARSQMAEGLLRHYYGDRFEAYSAGTVATSVNPYAVRAMAELGIDISGQRSKSAVELLEQGVEVDVVVTVCDRARGECPTFPGARRYLHRAFEDPAAVEGSDEEKMEAFRRVRDQIKAFLDEAFGGEAP